MHDAATSQSPPLSLHDALPISPRRRASRDVAPSAATSARACTLFPLPEPIVHSPAARSSVASTTSKRSSNSAPRSEEHTSELQSHVNLVCRLLLEKKKIICL